MAEKFKKEMGYLVEVPVWESHKRGKNWLAVITPDPKAPNGLARSFCNKGHGKYFYEADCLSVGDVVEFGADYYTGSGYKEANRQYGVIIQNTVDYIEIELFDSYKKAFEYSKTISPKNDDEKDEVLSKIETERLIRELEKRGYIVKEKEA